MKTPDQNLKQMLVKIYNKENITGGGGVGLFSSPAQPSGGGLFGGGSSTSTGGIFGGATPATPGGIFGGNSATVTPQKTGIFGSASSGSSIFGSAVEKQTGFSSPQPSGASLFGQSSTSTVASTPQPTGQSLFGGSGLFGAAAQSSVGGGGLFGKADSSGSGLFGQVEKQMDPACIWTPLDQLTEAEKAAYLAPEFELGCVPTRPPPKELCF